MPRYFLLCLGILAVPLLVWGVDDVVTRDINDTLQERILPFVLVTAEQDGQVITQTTSDGAMLVSMPHAVGLESAIDQPNPGIIHFSGTGAPDKAMIRILIPDQNVVRATMSDATGHWEVSIPTETLTPGQHAAYIQAMYQGNVSNKELIAQFTVQARETITQASWIFLFTTGITMLCLLLAITLQLRHNMLKPAVI